MIVGISLGETDSVDGLARGDDDFLDAELGGGGDDVVGGCGVCDEGFVVWDEHVSVLCLGWGYSGLMWELVGCGGGRGGVCCGGAGAWGRKKERERKGKGKGKGKGKETGLGFDQLLERDAPDEKKEFSIIPSISSKMHNYIRDPRASSLAIHLALLQTVLIHIKMTKHGIEDLARVRKVRLQRVDARLGVGKGHEVEVEDAVAVGKEVGDYMAAGFAAAACEEDAFPAGGCHCEVKYLSFGFMPYSALSILQEQELDGGFITKQAGSGL